MALQVSLVVVNLASPAGEAPMPRCPGGVKANFKLNSMISRAGIPHLSHTETRPASEKP